VDQIEETSPDGRILVRFDIDHGRMSHEIWTPTIVEAATGQILLHIRRGGIDGRPQWRSGGFTLGLRDYYHPDLWLRLEVDLNRGTFRFDGTEADEPIAALSDRVDSELGLQIDSADGRADRRRRVQTARDGGFVVLIIALCGAAAWLTLA
jgi:hypothetical protein